MPTTQDEFYRGLERASAALASCGERPAARAAAVHDALRALLVEGARGAACGAGCAHCCHFPVGVRLGEALRVAAAVADDEVLLARVHAEGTATRALPWHQLAGRACPLLVDGRCARYDARPTPCRALASFDAAACERALEEPVPVPRDEASWWRGLGAASALDDAHGPRELRAAVAALLTIGLDAPDDVLAAAFAGARRVPGDER